jgi:WD40 repeat protein
LGCREVLAGHGAWVSSVALAANGTVGVTVSGDETGVVWDLSSASFLKVLEGHSGEVRSVVLTRHGRCVLLFFRILNYHLNALE